MRGRIGRFVGEEEILSFYGVCVCTGEVRVIVVDVNQHITCHVSHGGFFVRADIMDQLGAGVGSALGCSTLLVSNGVYGEKYDDVDSTGVVQEDSYNLLYFSYSSNIQGSCRVNWVCQVGICVVVDMRTYVG